MGLKARLLLLMTGIAILPILSSSLLVFTFQRLYPGVVSFKGSPLEFVFRQMEPHLAEAIRSGDFFRFSEGPETQSVRIEESRTGRVVFERPGMGEPRPGADTMIVEQTVDGRDYRATFQVQAAAGSLNPSLILPFLPIFALGSVILFTVGVSLGILRSLGLSIGKLEAATRAISAGNLDFDLALPSGDSLGSLAASMDSMRRKLKEEYARRDRFILAVSHDLKTPLAVLEGYLDAFTDGLADSPEKRAAYLDVLREKTGLLGHRISHLVELARMTTVEWRQTLEECGLSGFLSETLKRLADEAAARGRRLEVDFRLPEGLSVAMNRDMVLRIFENLVDNAENYSPRDSVLRAEAWSGEGEAFVRVTNEGPGIPAGSRDLVYEPFYRADAGRNTGGFGLGLSSVKSIVEAHGWSIELQSVPGGATSFTVRIPLAAGTNDGKNGAQVGEEI